MGGRKSRNRPQPQSHYAQLNPEQASQIRPFIFFNLPGEIRNSIYFYLSIAERAPFSTDDHLKSFAVGRRVLLEHRPDAQLPNKLRLRWTPAYQGPYPKILQTCKQIYYEAADLFYAVHPVDLRIDLGSGDFNFTDMPILQIKRIQTLRIHIIVSWDQLVQAANDSDPWFTVRRVQYPSTPPTGTIRLRNLFEQATSVRKVYVMVEYLWGYEGRFELGAHRLRRLLHDVTEGIPEMATIKWGGWSSAHINLPKQVGRRYEHHYLDASSLERLKNGN